MVAIVEHHVDNVLVAGREIRQRHHVVGSSGEASGAAAIDLEDAIIAVAREVYVVEEIGRIGGTLRSAQQRGDVNRVALRRAEVEDLVEIGGTLRAELEMVGAA